MNSEKTIIFKAINITIGIFIASMGIALTLQSLLTLSLIYSEDHSMSASALLFYCTVSAYSFLHVILGIGFFRFERWLMTLILVLLAGSILMSLQSYYEYQRLPDGASAFHILLRGGVTFVEAVLLLYLVHNKARFVRK